MEWLIGIVMVFLIVRAYVNASNKNNRNDDDDNDSGGGGGKKLNLPTKMAIGATAGYVAGKHMAMK